MNRRGRRLLITLAAFTGVAVLLYAAAPVLLATIAARALTGVVDVRTLDIESVGLTRVEVADFRASSGQTDFEAQHAVLRYDLWPFKVRRVDIARARLVLPQAPATSGATSGAPAVPTLPPFALRIADLSFEADTPLGTLKIPASVEAGPGPAGGLEAEIRSPGFILSLHNPAAHRQALTLQDAAGEALLSLNAVTEGGYPVSFDGRLAPTKTAQWIRSSTALPSGLKDTLSPFGVDGEDIQFEGTLEGNLDFSARLHGRLGVQDQRNGSARVFDTIEIQAPSGYEVSRAGSAWSGSGDARLHVSLDAETAFDGRTPSWHWDGDGLRFHAAEAGVAPLGLHAGSIDVAAAALSTAEAHGEIHASGVRMPGWPQGLAYYEVDGSWSWHGVSFRADGSGSGRALPRLAWNLDSSGDQGTIEITSHQPVADLSPSLKPYIQSIASELKITSGKLEARFHLAWNAKTSKASLEVGADSVDADLDEMEIRGMGVSLENQGDSIDRLTLAASAPSLKLGAGTVAEKLELKLRVALPQIHVDAARFHLLGGDIALRPTTINLKDDEFVLFADIDSVSLEKVIGLFNLESTQLTGQVAGPVRILFNRERGLEINQGDLHSVEPGVLRFSISPDSEASAQFDNIALQALKNFQYQELKASLLYKPDGEYRITARIVGNNPDVLNGHPIALNPTIEGRLPALFRAFFVTGDFDRVLLETLQKERSSSTPGKTPSFQSD